MNENPLADLDPENGDLPCQTIVYRAALDETWFSSDGTEVESVAFYRRRGEYDSGGISIGATPYAHREAGITGPIAGIISVHVGHVRNVTDAELRERLDVEFDDYPHGNITNAPPKERRGPRRRLADRIASLLARIAARPHEIFDPPHN